MLIMQGKTARVGAVIRRLKSEGPGRLYLHIYSLLAMRGVVTVWLTDAVNCSSPSRDRRGTVAGPSRDDSHHKVNRIE